MGIKAVEKRITGLDFLRGVAVLLVFFRHAVEDNILHFIGWAGVDLFFVLSGFLVSGLIFKEYKEKNKVDLKKFLIRRGFKIYPPFYFFIIVSLILKYIFTQEFYSISQILNEIFYLQSYRDGMWIHTWSLAVEEHFYIGLALVMAICLKYKLIENVKFMISFLIGWLVITFCMRFNISYQNIDQGVYTFTQTHLRIDGILIGVLVSYLYYFTNFYLHFKKFKHYLLLIAFIFISPLFIFQGGSFEMNTLGLTTVNLGFGIIVLYSLDVFTNKVIKHTILKVPVQLMSFIGLHSYSIYLWHLLPDNIINTLFHRESFILTLVLTLLTGIIFSIIIEKPFLKIRDKFYAKN
jgi:peptidoglycan/LPS O-acetylase OafA/YrhL